MIVSIEYLSYEPPPGAAEPVTPEDEDRMVSGVLGILSAALEPLLPIDRVRYRKRALFWELAEEDSEDRVELQSEIIEAFNTVVSRGGVRDVCLVERAGGYDVPVSGALFHLRFDVEMPELTAREDVEERVHEALDALFAEPLAAEHELRCFANHVVYLVDGLLDSIAERNGHRVYRCTSLEDAIAQWKAEQEEASKAEDHS